MNNKKEERPFSVNQVIPVTNEEYVTLDQRIIGKKGGFFQKIASKYKGSPDHHFSVIRNIRVTWDALCPDNVSEICSVKLVYDDGHNRIELFTAAFRPGKSISFELSGSMSNSLHSNSQPYKISTTMSFDSDQIVGHLKIQLDGYTVKTRSRAEENMAFNFRMLSNGSSTSDVDVIYMIRAGGMMPKTNILKVQEMCDSVIEQYKGVMSSLGVQMNMGHAYSLLTSFSAEDKKMFDECNRLDIAPKRSNMDELIRKIMVSADNTRMLNLLMASVMQMLP
ncbi:putative cell-to-cell movement protein [Peach virus 1]|uniref:Putative cell-to-cell movement protein n=1 Tax=Peach virus 1 TaxID=2721273 RepID=A0A6G9L5Y5_9RHAB|nr:putative cell-to-cell movement protein [Peach virus 1]QIQ60847.1 putative cell-to-cell movement protein [Peach virus 1]